MNTFIAEFRELAKRATPLPWRATDYTHEPTGTPGLACDEWEVFPVSPGVLVNPNDAPFIAASVNTVSLLLDVVEAAQRLVDSDLIRWPFEESAQLRNAVLKLPLNLRHAATSFKPCIGGQAQVFGVLEKASAGATEESYAEHQLLLARALHPFDTGVLTGVYNIKEAIRTHLKRDITPADL